MTECRPARAARHDAVDMWMIVEVLPQECSTAIKSISAPRCLGSQASLRSVSATARNRIACSGGWFLKSSNGLTTDGPRELPGREGVGREALVYERNRRLEAFVGEVLVIGSDMIGEEHSLADDGRRRQ